MRVNTAKLIGYVLILAAIAIVFGVLYRNNARKHVPIVFSPKSMLAETWERYKERYLEEGTYRAIDRQRSDITTSEGQSYSLLRSVWIGDHDAFDRTWQWTKDNLQFDNGRLFSWLFGKRSDGTFGILTELGGQNSASDADVDIALALAFAYARWQDDRYLGDAHDIIRDIWDEDVVMIHDRPYLAASNIERLFADEVIVNPSYLAPYAYRIFAEIDTSHDWMALVDTSYDVIAQSMELPLDAGGSAGLPPNWIGIDQETGKIVTIQNNPDLTTDYSYDALRTPWRLALDWKWNGEPRARALLSSMGFLDEEWRNGSTIASEYAHNGTRRSSAESPAMYGGSLGALMVINPGTAQEVYETKLQSLYSPDTTSWKQPLGYYDDNWAWFGMALYNDELPDLWNIVSPRSTSSGATTTPEIGP